MEQYIKYEYKIKEILLHLEEYAEVKVILDSEEEYKIVLKFTNGLIRKFIIGSVSEEEVKSKLENLLSDKDNFLLIRLIRLALGNEIIKEQLKNGQNGIFNIDLAKWEKILKKIKEEKLEKILEQGIKE